MNRLVSSFFTFTRTWKNYFSHRTAFVCYKYSTEKEFHGDSFEYLETNSFSNTGQISTASTNQHTPLSYDSSTSSNLDNIFFTDSPFNDEGDGMLHVNESTDQPSFPDNELSMDVNNNESTNRRLTLSDTFEVFLNTNPRSTSVEEWSNFLHKFLNNNLIIPASKAILEMQKNKIPIEHGLYLSYFLIALNNLLVEEIAHIFLRPSEFLNRPHRSQLIESVKKVFSMYRENPEQDIETRIYYRIATVFYRFKSIKYYRMLLEYLENHRMPVPIPIFNMLMSLLAEYPNFFHNVKMIYSARKATDGVDDSSTYWFLMSTIKAKQFDELKSLMTELHSKNEATIRHYELIIQLLLKYDFAQEAVSTFNDLKLLKGFEPSKHIYSSFLIYYGFKSKNMKELSSIFADFMELHPNVEGNSDIYALYLRAASTLSPHQVSEFLGLLIERKVAITHEIYGSVINFILSSSISYEARSILSSLFNNWASVDDLQTSYVVDPRLQPVVSKLPISVYAILGHMYAKGVDSFTLDIVSTMIRYFYTSQCWDEVIELWRAMEKPTIFTKPSTFYQVLLAAIYARKKRITATLLHFISKRRVIIVDKYVERLHEALLEFSDLPREHAIFRILKAHLNPANDGRQAKGGQRKNRAQNGGFDKNSSQESARYRRQPARKLEEDKVFSSYSSDPLF